jgi:hypothetical protein
MTAAAMHADMKLRIVTSSSEGRPIPPHMTLPNSLDRVAHLRHPQLHLKPCDQLPGAGIRRSIRNTTFATTEALGLQAKGS